MELFFLTFISIMTEPFTAAMMDQSPSLLSSRFLQEVTTHASTLAVSPLRPNGLNDLHICVPSLAYALIHPDHINGFSIAPLAPLSADATPVDRHNHTIASADLLVIIQGVQTLKTFALSLVGSVISATLHHPTTGFTKVRIVDIIDHITVNYGVLSRADLSTLDKRMTTYVPSKSLAQNFTVYDDTHALLLHRGLAVADIIKLDNLYSALQADLTQKHRLDLYLAQHPNRINQSYIKAKKYLLQLERSMSDISISTLIPPSLPLPSVAAAAIASPTASEFAI